MNLKISNNKWTITGLILVFILLLAGVYFLFVYPKMGVMDRKESELKMQQQLLATLENNMEKSNDNTFKNTTTLQKLVPVKPLSEQLLLTIEKAEVVSKSFVLSMDFSEAELTIEEKTPEEKDQEAFDESYNLDENTESEGDNTEEAAVQNEETPIENNGETDTKKSLLPQGIKKITISMNVESPSYFELESFINTLENSERIMIIESIDFTSNEEIIELEQVDKPITYQVTVSAFYMPTLTDLMDQLPRIDGTVPAEKKNPFSSFGSILR